MDITDFLNILKQASGENNITHLIDDEKSDILYNFSEFLLSENEKYNLTAIRDTTGIIYKHFVDSLLIADHIPLNSKVIDIGCGAGFPSLPLAIVRRDLKVTSLDSANKKVNFVGMCIEKFGLQNASAVCARAEELAHSKDYREKYDIALTRAVSAFPVVTELSVGFLKVGGQALIMKGREGDKEFDTSPVFRQILNIESDPIIFYDLKIQDLHEARTLLKIKKLGKTPDNFPRNYAQITKKPLK